MNTSRAIEIADAIVAAIAAAAEVPASTINAASIVAAIMGPEPIRPHPGESKAGLSTIVDGRVVYSG